MSIKAALGNYRWRLFHSEPFEVLRLNLMRLNRLPPIVVYTMGKVGSSTVYETLRRSGMTNPIYHVHFLAQESIEQVEAHVRTLPKDIVHRHLLASRALRRELHGGGRFPWYVITLVRDPVARHISEFFETMWMFHPDLTQRDGAINPDGALNLIRTQLFAFDEARDRATKWFEREFEPALGIDVYKYDFDGEVGFGTIVEGRFRVALLTLENLDTNWNKLARFLGFSRALSVAHSNVGEEKESWASAYRYVKQHLRLPRAVCEQVYGSRLVTHFYTPETRMAFVKRWLGDSN